MRFPHYVLVVSPFLAAYGMVALGRLARAGGRLVAVALVGVVAVSLGAVVLDDVRLIRAADAVDMRTLSAEAVAGLPRPAWSESYGVAAPAADRVVFAFGQDPSGARLRLPRRAELLPGGALPPPAPTSTPPRSPRYDAPRARGRVVRVVRPVVPLAYNWDLLPQWGVRLLPLSGPVGPTLTILDLTTPKSP